VGYKTHMLPLQPSAPIVAAGKCPRALPAGVRLRSNPDSEPLPPPNQDLNLPFIESQLTAVADPDDDNLLVWRKDETPFLALPPPNQDLTG